MDNRLRVTIAVLFCVGVGSPVTASWIGLSEDGALPITLEEAPRLFEQCSRFAPRPDGKYWLPSSSEIEALEESLEGYFSENLRQLDWLVGRRLRKYRGQYVGFERAGVGYIYASYLSESRRMNEVANGQALITCDGGSSAWGIVYNPSTGELSEFFGNGN